MHLFDLNKVYQLEDEKCSYLYHFASCFGRGCVLPAVVLEGRPQSSISSHPSGNKKYDITLIDCPAVAGERISAMIGSSGIGADSRTEDFAG